MPHEAIYFTWLGGGSEASPARLASIIPPESAVALLCDPPVTRRYGIWSTSRGKVGHTFTIHLTSCLGRHAGWQVFWLSGILVDGGV